jgi:prepilin-type N-terminal cleavage/methylation domain-containing protein
MRQRGFTLIEVVVAMAILGVGLIVIIELFSGGLRLGRASEEYSRAVSFARMKMEEVSLQEYLEEGEEAGDFDKDYRWQVAVKKMDILPLEKNPDFQPLIELYQIKVNILWKSGSKEKSAGVETYKTTQAEAPSVITEGSPIPKEGPGGAPPR